LTVTPDFIHRLSKAIQDKIHRVIQKIYGLEVLKVQAWKFY